ncbi:MAG: tetraacyldisaccharide 4'-kinase [Tenuifilaceae bacterium]|jgi:tetraacyldisaccharide 4'-kinase|nr:tetraacyldisaccharide 4'-kinase [Tenuifilaceae bacterium]
MNFRFLLAPLSLLYGIAVYARNWLFDVGFLESHSFSTPTICVGNLTVGGTGKTPHTEHLVKSLHNDFSVATLSRGYKRRTKGFLMATQASNAHDIGDEPMQIKLKFPETTVAVDENRVRGINNLLQINPNIDVILLDDAYQHRYVKAGLNILLTDYSNLIYSDYLLPMGRLRDSIVQKRRANTVIVTKCPKSLDQAAQNKIAKKLNLSEKQELYFTTLQYGSLEPVFDEIDTDENSISNCQIMALAGIANPKPFFKYLEKEHAVCKIMHYPDHYHFTETKIKAIFEKFSKHPNKPVAIVTTEKDAARIKVFNNLPTEIRSVFYYIPIEVDFLNAQGNDFNNKLHEYVRKSKRNNGIHSEQGNR